MKLLKGIVNVILSFLMTLLIIANFGLNIFSNTILKKEYVLSQLEENDIYEKVETDLKNGFENYRYQSGLPEEVFHNLYTTDMVRTDVNSIINNLYEGTENTNSSEKVRSRIVENINTYLQENNIVLSKTQEENMNEFQDLIVKVYENKVNIATDRIKQVTNIKVKVEEIIKLAKISLMVVTIVIILFAILVNIKTLGIFINTISISLIASGILLKLVPWLVNKNIDINNILLLTQTLSDFIKVVIYDILSKFNTYGIGFVVIGVVGVIMSNYHRIK